MSSGAANSDGAEAGAGEEEVMTGPITPGATAIAPGGGPLGAGAGADAGGAVVFGAGTAITVGNAVMMIGGGASCAW